MTSPSHPVNFPASFDVLAQTYDQVFEDNPITARIRPIFWRSLLAHFKTGDHVLELNCGTGTDAIMLAENGVQVTAIDSSERMIAGAEEKAREKGVSQLIRFQQRSFEHLVTLGRMKFDGAFSNFGGLNCTSNIDPVLETLSGLLKPHASVVVCMINKFSLWEMVSFLLRGNLRSAFRRMRRQPTTVRLGSSTVEVCYYTPKEFIRILSPYFEIEHVYGL
ncbi:MAG: methyltransferase domain-containing protein, partial [Ignavibacteriae bacterium]|nr:methyltransferase domain-containing protein [Ignavibacteriota bacterium]